MVVVKIEDNKDNKRVGQNRHILFFLFCIEAFR